jgi:hypothetical protein
VADFSIVHGVMDIKAYSSSFAFELALGVIKEAVLIT